MHAGAMCEQLVRLGNKTTFTDKCYFVVDAPATDKQTNIGLVHLRGGQNAQGFCLSFSAGA